MSYFDSTTINYEVFESNIELGTFRSRNRYKLNFKNSLISGLSALVVAEMIFIIIIKCKEESHEDVAIKWNLENFRVSV